MIFVVVITRRAMNIVAIQVLLAACCVVPLPTVTMTCQQFFGVVRLRF